MILPKINNATVLNSNKRRVIIGAYGFEKRSLGWAKVQENNPGILDSALIFKYKPSKGRNKISELKRLLEPLCLKTVEDRIFNTLTPHKEEKSLKDEIRKFVGEAQEIVIDITAMTKLLIMFSLCTVGQFKGTVRIVYSEAEDYSPTEAEYEKSKTDMSLFAKYPHQGVESIIRMKCLSSIRMQGQPVTLIAFTSFNEQLIRHMLGTMNPHRLIFINGRSPRRELVWREKATQEIHGSIIKAYITDNKINKEGLLKCVCSTLDYTETVDMIDRLHDRYGQYERIICAATGSKMQTVGLFFSKMEHPDIHIEYPTPDSYFVKGISKGIRQVHEIVIPSFSEFMGLLKLRNRNISESADC